MKITYEQAQEIILKALKPLGEEYLGLIKRAFEENNGVIKKEKIFPAIIVKRILKNALLKKVNNETQEEVQYRNCGSLCIGGTGDMYLCKDKTKMDYIFQLMVKMLQEQIQTF